MTVLRFFCALMAIFVFATFFFVSPILANSNQDTASVAIADAEETMISTYEAVLEAEQAGGNVSGLLAQLNEAGWFLVRARMAYKSGDFDSALKFATQSQEKLNGFVADANALTENAIQERYWGFMVNVVGSVIGAIVVVCVGFIVWSFLKRKYEKAGSMV